MTRLAILTFVLGALLLAGLVLGARVAARPLVDVEAREPQHRSSPTTAPEPHTGAANPSSGARVVVHDPFRVSRRAARVAYNPLVNSGPSIRATPRPTLVLAGIVWEQARPTALLEGLPGSDGPKVVGPGDSFGELRVTAIHRDRVIVADRDTVWTLKVREPWK